MMEEKHKPLHFTPDPTIGFTAERRADGGMRVIFTDVNHRTLMYWREFALAHLLDSDGLTRNLYDLRQIRELPEEAIQTALEVNNDPAAGNIRLAVVVGNETVRTAVEEIVALTTFGRARVRIFTDPDQAESWLSRPLRSMV